MENGACCTGIAAVNPLSKNREKYRAFQNEFQLDCPFADDKPPHTSAGGRVAQAGGCFGDAVHLN
jgi:hypothetical protein